jgi:YVTN family beta-propeller protein
MLATVPVGNFPCAISVAPDGSAAWVTNRLSNNVSVIDLATLQVTNIPVGTFACDVMVTMDGSRAVVTNRLSGDITVIDAIAKVALATIPTGTNPQGVAFSADGTRAYITNAGSVAVVDLQSLTVVDTIASIASGPCPVGSTMDFNRADEGHVYVASNTAAGVVTVLDAGTNSVIAVFNVGVRPLGVGIRMWPPRM